MSPWEEHRWGLGKVEVREVIFSEAVGMHALLRQAQ